MKHYLWQVRRHPGFSLVAILTLALAAGINGWGFSFLRTMLFDPSPIPRSAEVVALHRTKPNTAAAPWSPADYDDLQRSNTFLKRTAAYSFAGVNFSAPGLPAEHLRSLQVTGGFFSVFEVPALLGRTLAPDDARKGAARVAVLSEGYWRRRFESDPQVIGRAIRLDGNSVTIVGVMPSRFDHPFAWGAIELWTPMETDWTLRSSEWLSVIARLNPGQTIDQAAAAARVFAQRLAHDYPQNDAQTGIRFTPWEELRRGGLQNRNIFLFSTGMSLAVLLIACANLANLQLARAAGRTREFGVRLALGASRWRLAGQLLGENLVLSILGGAFGVLFAEWGMRWTVAAITRDDFDGSAFQFTPASAIVVFALALLAGVMFGIMPALFAVRTDIQSALKQGARGATEGSSRHRLRNLLIVTEIAASLMLLSMAGYFLTGLRGYVNGDWGWKPDRMLVANLDLPWNSAYSTDAQCRQFYRRLQDSLGGIAGVQSAGLAGWLPVNHFWLTHRVAVDGIAPPPPGREPVAYENPVSPGYFAALGMDLVAGRPFDSFDRAESAQVVVINAAMARALWPHEPALHHRIRYLDGGDTQWAEVVGVVDDVRSGLDLFVPIESRWQTYRPLAQVPIGNAHNLSLALRIAPGSAPVGASVRAAIAQLDPDLPVYGLMSARTSLGQILSGIGILSETLNAMALFGMLLASIGIYGVIANLVARRTAEIGIRIALGATPKHVLALVISNGVILSVTGAAIGALVSCGLFRMLGSLLPSFGGGGMPLVAAVTFAMIAIALMASWIPARRAARLDPVVALRAE